MLFQVSLPIADSQIARRGGYKLGWVLAVGLVCFAGMVPVVLAQDGVYHADFEEPDFTPGSIDGQQGWWVDQGSAMIVPGAGLLGSAALAVSPAALFSQARLSLERTAQSSPVVFFDAWVRLPAAPWQVLDETFNLDSARIGLFHTSPFSDAAEWHVFHGDGAGGGYWLGTGVQAGLLQDVSFTAEWSRITVRMDAPSLTWDVWADGQMLASGLGMQFAPEPDLAHFFVLGDPAQPILLDEVTISSVDPLPPADSGPAAGGAGPPETDLTDTDADGLPDTWETARQLNPMDAADATSDRDGDGLTALDEFLLGTGESTKDAQRLIVSDGATVFNRFAGQSARRAAPRR